MATDGGLSVPRDFKAFIFAKIDIGWNWYKDIAKTGNLGAIGKAKRPLTKWSRELANVRRELALTKMET